MHIYLSPSTTTALSLSISSITNYKIYTDRKTNRTYISLYSIHFGLTLCALQHFTKIGLQGTGRHGKGRFNEPYNFFSENDSPSSSLLKTSLYVMISLTITTIASLEMEKHPKIVGTSFIDLLASLCKFHSLRSGLIITETSYYCSLTCSTTAHHSHFLLSGP